MSNPTYTLVINVIIGMHKSHRDVLMQFKRYIDFVPFEGMKIKLANEQDAELDIDVINLHYDYTNKQFVEWQKDDTLVEALKDKPELSVLPESLESYIKFYESMGFEKR